MSSVGSHGVGWFILLCGVGCATGAAPPAKDADKAAAAQVDARPPALPPLTPAPPAVLEAQVVIDFGRFFAGISAGTKARLDLSMMSQLWQVPGLELERPVALGMTGGASNSSIFASAIQPGAALKYGPADPELAARGLKPLADGTCAVRESGPGAPALACGSKEQLLAFGEDLLSRSRALREGQMAELKIHLSLGPTSAVHEWRAAVPREIDALLPEASDLGKQPGLRLGLHDLAFELIDRASDSYRRLGPLSVALSPGEADAFALNAALEPGAGSVLARAVATGKNVRIPDAFWELPSHANQALFFDASLLAPLLELSPRTQKLLAEASGKGSLVEQLLALPQSCAAPGQAWAVAWVNPPQPAHPAEPAKPALPELGELQVPETPSLPSYTLLGIEDPKGACTKLLRSLLLTHERGAHVAGLAADQRHLSMLPVEKPLPRTLALFRLGSGEEATHVALGERKGVLWVGSSSDLTALKAGLADLLTPAPKRRGLRSRPELADLGKPPALVSGFLREDNLPFSSLGMTKRRLLERAKDPASPELRRIAFAITRDQATLKISGRLEARSLRQLFAKGISDNLGAVELSRLAVEKVGPALAMLEAACQLGGGDACNVLGVTYGDARGVPKDTARAVSWLEIGCERGSGMACANLVFYKTMDKEEELKLLQRSCELDAPFGCAWWGVKLLDRDKPGDQQQGFEKLASACNQFVPFACARIGNHYQEGIGLPQDDTKGADFHQRACELGLGVGCVGVAAALATGKGRKQDTDGAFKSLQRACKLDKQEGCYALGLAYLYGEITAKNEALARQELGVACEASHADACRVLAELSGEP